MDRALHDPGVTIEGKKAVHTKMTVKPPAAREWVREQETFQLLSQAHTLTHTLIHTLTRLVDPGPEDVRAHHL